jgi:MFS family permease
MHQLPFLIFGLFAGVLADRVNKRKTLILTISFTLAQVLLMGTLTVTGYVKVWHLLVLSLLWGTMVSFTTPLRHSFIFDLVGKKDLSNALSLNSMSANIARIIGPAIGGFLVGLISEGPCFFINAALLTMFIVALTQIKTKKITEVKQTDSILFSLKSGLKYAWKNAFIRYPLMLLMFVSLIVMPVTVLMPVAAKQLLAGDARTLGILMSSFGVGALAGSLSMAARKGRKGLVFATGLSSLGYGLSLIIFAVSKNIYLSCFVLFLGGIGMSRQATGVNILVQSFVSNNMRGRVMSLYMITFVGFAPFGSLFMGRIADIYGISVSLLLCAFWAIASAVWFLAKIPLIKISAYRLIVKEKNLNGSKATETFI